MHLHEFGLEILVNGQPLPEYNLPISESNMMNTSVSYVVDSLTQVKKYSDFTTYVPVEKPGERYTVRFEAKQANPSNIIISRIYIDGQSDQIQHLHHQQSLRTRSFFCNHERTKVYFFKFSNTFDLDKKEDITNNHFKIPNNNPSIQQQQSTYGKPGSITVCFYKGIIVDQNLFQNKTESEFDVKQVKILETTDNNNTEIGYTTGFDVMHAKIQPATVTKIVDLNPMAVLHLHYRSADWFSVKKLPLHQDLGLIMLDVNEIEKKNNKVAKESQEIMQIENNKNAEQNLGKGEAIILQNSLKRSHNEIDILDEKDNALKKLCIK